MPTWMTQMLPESRVARRLSVQSVLYAFGDGVFTTGNAVYFTQIVGLSAAQVGLGLSLSGLAVFALSVPMGRLADRYGARRMWALGAVLEASLYLSYPFIHGFPPFLLLLTAFSIVATVGGAGRGAYTIGIFMSELSDPHRRGEYQGVWGLGGRLTNILGPATYTWLALDHGAVGWVVIATTIVLAAALLHPAVRAAERFLATHELDVSRAPA